jgi:hypothetical protein
MMTRICTLASPPYDEAGMAFLPQAEWWSVTLLFPHIHHQVLFSYIYSYHYNTFDPGQVVTLYHLSSIRHCIFDILSYHNAQLHMLEITSWVLWLLSSA